MQILIVYTNLSEEEILPIKNMLEKLENNNVFRIGIVHVNKVCYIMTELLFHMKRGVALYEK